jgi:hypothetical protein
VSVLSVLQASFTPPVLIPYGWYLPGKVRGVRLPANRAAGNQNTPGTGTLADSVGRVFPQGTAEVPTGRRVTLIDRITMQPISTVWSDPATGAYSFGNLRTDIPFMVLVDDYEGILNADVADWVYAE